MDKQSKNTRRKRKDPESRDFQCKCGKSYLSYAAAYTHVKNKHNLEKDFVQNIRKPEREQLKRGRPKEKKASNQTAEISLLTLIESAILKICNELQTAFEKVILEGNEEREETAFNQQFQSLCDEKKLHLTGFSMGSTKPQLEQFITSLNKDFTVQIATRIKLIVMMIYNMENDYENDYLVSKLANLNLWTGRNATNQIILDTYREWNEKVRLYERNIDENQ